MTKQQSSYLISLLLIGQISFCQSVNMPIKEITNLLCKKWSMNYIMYGNTKINATPDNGNQYYEFKPDKTFSLQNKEYHLNISGTWDYIEKDKVIKTYSGGKNDTIISLTKNEFIILVKTVKGTPITKVAYKPFSL